jgi:hypothetical protein
MKLGKAAISQMLNMKDTARAIKRGIGARRSGKSNAQGNITNILGLKKPAD